MCEFAERMTQRGIKQGISQGISQGINQEREHGIAALVESLRELNVPDMGIVEVIIKRYALSKTAAKKYVH
ncbi:MAG: hypothetical protein PHN80_10830 [Hespellia sp.]|nr:hypothetical protein [Hespellia sp.]